jgi:two-component system nitrate/nitrite sensor histidine kinase NarX
MASQPIQAKDTQGRRSFLIVAGALMSLVLVLGLTAMVSALVIADLTQGMAAAVNQSGTLRMQSYRVGLALAAGAASTAEREAEIARRAAGLEQRLADPRLTNVIPDGAADPVRQVYDRIQRRWSEDLLPAVERGGGDDYLRRVDGFVDELHELVRLLEERAERRIGLLWVIQSVALVCTMIVAVFTLLLLRRRVLKPLHGLLRVAERAGAGDFTTRTPYVGADELGRLGGAMNRMSQDLAELYGQLEDRVADKTRDLERSNRSLRLLYRSAQSLDGTRLARDTLHAVLCDLRRDLGLASVRLCLRAGCADRDAAEVVSEPVAPGEFPPASATAGGAERAVEIELDAECNPERCPTHCECGPLGDAGTDAGEPTAVAFPVADQHTAYGTLWVLPEADNGLADWQQPVLLSWTRQLATALNLRARLRESRRLVLHEERSILARELHDSLAQSLTYLKIQAMRLQQSLAASRGEAGAAGTSDPAPDAVLADMRDGINSAYRHLRELLTSFRLKIDDAGLGAAIRAAVAECRAQSELAVVCDDRLGADRLSPNQEVHVLQIVREALANVRHHARASQVRVSLRESGGDVAVEVVDDGIGMDAVEESWGHHGLGIMRERARSLAGRLEFLANAGGGTRVRLRFPARANPAQAKVNDHADRDPGQVSSGMPGGPGRTPKA